MIWTIWMFHSLGGGSQCQFKPFAVSSQDLAERSNALLRQEISFIHSPKFSRMKLGRRGMEVGRDLYRGKDRSANRRGSGRSDLPVIPVPQAAADSGREQHLFRRMNYLRYLANRKRSQLDPEHLDSKVIREIEKLIADSEAARTQLVESNLRLVASIARKFSKSRNDFEELLSEGNSILLYAVDKFDFSRGFRSAPTPRTRSSGTSSRDPADAPQAFPRDRLPATCSSTRSLPPLRNRSRTADAEPLDAAADGRTAR